MRGVPVGDKRQRRLGEFRRPAQPRANGVMRNRDLVEITLFDHVDYDGVSIGISGAASQYFQPHAIPGNVHSLIQCPDLICDIKVVAHVTNLNTFGISPGGDQKLRLLRSHAASLGMSYNRNSCFFLDPGCGAQHQLLVISDAAFARAGLDDPGLDPGAPDTHRHLRHEELVKFLPYVAQTGAEFPIGRGPLSFVVIPGGTDDVHFGFLRDFFQNFDVPATIYRGRIDISPETKILELLEKRHSLLNGGSMIERNYSLITFPARITTHN